MELICLGVNYAEFKNDCIEQCEDCKRFQHKFNNPVKIPKKEIDEMESGFQLIKYKANFKM